MRGSIAGRVFTLFILLCTVILASASSDDAPLLGKRAPPDRTGQVSGLVPPDVPPLTPTAPSSTPAAPTTSPPGPSGPPPPPPPPPGSPGATTTTIISNPNGGTTTSSSTTTTSITSSPTTVTTTSASSTTSAAPDRTTTSSATTAATTKSMFLPPLPTMRSTLVFTGTASGDPSPTDTGLQNDGNASGASGQNFWSNKGAVAGVFSIVGLIGLALLFAGVTYFMRRRSDRFRDEEFFEKYPDSSHGIDDAISVHDVTTQAAADAYPDRHIHYGMDPVQADSYSSQQHYPVDTLAQHQSPVHYAQYPAPNQHGGPAHAHVPSEDVVAHTSGTAYAQPQAVQHLQQDTQAAYDVNPSPSVVADAAVAEEQQHVPTAPKQGGGGPPVTYRDPTARQSYQQSIDSFYGAPVSR